MTLLSCLRRVLSHDRWFLDRVATHILAWDGEHLGHVRRDGRCPPGECRVAVPKAQARPCGRYGNAQAAAAALAQACGKTTRNTG
jgi:ATPase subunit of ABC transporter with duplicated ATPase domains